MFVIRGVLLGHVPRLTRVDQLLLRVVRLASFATYDHRFAETRVKIL